MYPESNPVADTGLHGFAKVLCVTVWFFCLNSNVMVSPGLALMLFGEYANTPGPPTVTLIFVGVGATAAVVEVADGGAPVAEVEDGGAPVAAALNLAKSEPGLMAKTMPAPEQ
jgi:hypothetical protein